MFAAGVSLMLSKSFAPGSSPQAASAAWAARAARRKVLEEKVGGGARAKRRPEGPAARPPGNFSESTLRGARGPGLARSEIPIFSDMKRASGAYDHIPAFRLSLRITRGMDPLW